MARCWRPPPVTIARRIAGLVKTGIIDRNGRFAEGLDNKRVCKQGDEWAYVLTFAEGMSMEENIVFTESDLKNLIYSKGAVYAGFTTLLGHADMDFSMVGAYIALLSTNFRQEARMICDSMIYVDFSSNPRYMAELLVLRLAVSLGTW